MYRWSFQIRLLSLYIETVLTIYKKWIHFYLKPRVNMWKVIGQQSFTLNNIRHPWILCVSFDVILAHLLHDFGLHNWSLIQKLWADLSCWISTLFSAYFRIDSKRICLEFMLEVNSKTMKKLKREIILKIVIFVLQPSFFLFYIFDR